MRWPSTWCWAPPACRRSATAPISASAPMRSGSASSTSSPISGFAWWRRSRSRALAGALVALFISHRRGIYYAFMTIAFGQIFWTLAIKSHSITGGEDGLLEDRAPAGGFRLRLVRSRRQRRALLFRAGGVCAGCRGAVAAGEFALWPHRRGDPPERNPRRASRLQCLALQGLDLHAVGGGVRSCRRAVRDGAARGFPRRHEPAPVRLRRDDDAGRRRPRQLLGAGGRRLPVPDRARCDRRADQRLDALFRPAVHRDRAVPARRRRRCGLGRAPEALGASGGKATRRCGCCSEAGDGADRSRRRTCAFRRPRGAGKHRSRGARGRVSRHHGAERRRQDHLLQRAHRPGQAEPRLDPARRRGRHGPAARTGSPPRASRARSRS